MTDPNPERDERRCQHGLPINNPCDECNALAEAEEIRWSRRNNE